MNKNHSNKNYITMKIWNFLIIYSCWVDAGVKAPAENDTKLPVDKPAGDKPKQVILKGLIPEDEFKKLEKEVKKEDMKDKLKVRLKYVIN